MTKMHKIQPISGGGIMESVKIFPSIHFDETQLPELKNWKVGEDYIIQVKVTQTGLHEGRSGEMVADFEIKEVGAVGSAKKEKKDAKEEEEA